MSQRYLAKFLKISKKTWGMQKVSLRFTYKKNMKSKHKTHEMLNGKEATTLQFNFDSKGICEISF